MMIYEADKGTTLATAAREAVLAKCGKVLHNGTIYLIEITWKPVAGVYETPDECDSGTRKGGVI